MIFIVFNTTLLQPFIDSIRYEPEIEPLLRFKVTHLLLSDEYVLGTSFSRMVGDSDSNIHFLNDLSRIYQHFEPILPRPIFERPLLNKEDSDDSSFPLVMKLLQNAEKREDILARIIKEQTETDPLNMSFSSEQLNQLYNLVGNNNEVTIHDVLCAYIILTMNKHLFSTTDEYIRRAHILINYRGVSDAFAPKGHVANSVIQALSSNFSNPLSLSSIAQTIRQAIKAIRNEDVLKEWIISADISKKKLKKEGRMSFVWKKDEVVFNSNFKYDWVNQVNFGLINQCRFHTTALYKFYFRIFRLNPIKRQDGSGSRDNEGAEVAFRIPKGEGKEKFLKQWKKGIEENFLNVE